MSEKRRDNRNRILRNGERQRQDGRYSNFIMLDKNGNPKIALHIENEMRWAMKKYKKLHPDKPLPHITPHVFRHTFCMAYAQAGCATTGPCSWERPPRWCL